MYNVESNQGPAPDERGSERTHSVEALVLLRTIDAREQRDMRVEVTVSMEALILSWIIGASEKRDIPGAFKQADRDETLHDRLDESLHDHLDESLDGSL